MSIDLNFRPDGGDFAVFVDEERGSGHTHVGAAVHAFFSPHTVSGGDAVVDISAEWEAEAVFMAEFTVRCGVIWADADDDGVFSREMIQVLLEGAGFLSAARGVVFWVEVEHDILFTEVIAQTHGGTLVGRQRELWGLVTHLWQIGRFNWRCRSHLGWGSLLRSSWLFSFGFHGRGLRFGHGFFARLFSYFFCRLFSCGSSFFRHFLGSFFRDLFSGLFGYFFHGFLSAFCFNFGHLFSGLFRFSGRRFLLLGDRLFLTGFAFLGHVQLLRRAWFYAENHAPSVTYFKGKKTRVTGTPLEIPCGEHRGCG